jgi:hypothetical protein
MTTASIDPSPDSPETEKTTVGLRGWATVEPASITATNKTDKGTIENLLQLFSITQSSAFTL